MELVNRDEYLEQLKTLVNIDSGSLNPNGINLVADEIEKWYRDLGWFVKRHDLGDSTGNLLEISNHQSEQYDVLFVGHMDTVFPDGTVAIRPFTTDDVNAYGPGVGDMKNGDVAMYQVAKHMSKAAAEKLNICMLYNPDEEIGSIYSRDMMDAIAHRAKYVYVMESVSKNGTHCFSRKGRLQYTIAFHGQAAHSGFMFERKCASAVLEMGHYIVELMNLASREHDTTVNVGIANGGTAINMVADRAEIQVEMRYKYESEAQRLEAAVSSLLEGEPFVPWVTVEITKKDIIPSWAKTPDMLEHIAYMKKLADGLGIDFDEKDRGGLSDANHLAACGVICSDGMGPHGALDHSEKEYSIIDTIEPCVRLLCAILDDMAQTKQV